MARDLMKSRNPIESIPYSQFLSDVASSQLLEVKVHPDRIEGLRWSPPRKEATRFMSARIEDPDLVKRLASSGARFEMVHESGLLRDLLGWVFPLLLMGGFWWILLGRAGRGQAQFSTLGKSHTKVYVERGLKIRFSDVAGVDEAKTELREVVDFLKNPKEYGRLGGRMPKGLLLVGPPGTGKTLLARAVAGEAEVPFFSINGSEFVEMFVGLGAARVRDLFEQARRQAPCIIFIDEMDALGKARGLSIISGGANDEKEQTLNQLLAELDGFDPTQGVVLLAATNRPEILDPALLRSGRFDRQVLIDMPDRVGRTEILKIHFKKVNLGEDVDAATISSLTAGFSGADLENLVNEAALIATRRKAISVEAKDFTAGIERIVGGLERRSRVLSYDEKRRVAFHEMGHTAVSLALDQGETVHKVSIIPRGIGALGYTMRRPIEDRYLLSRVELERKLAILLAGRASESVFFKDISTGAADDLDKATEIARSMVTRYGMGQDLGLMTYERSSAPFLDPRRTFAEHEYSEVTAHLIDQETSRLTEHAFMSAVRTIKHHEDFIRKCVGALLERETLEEHEIKLLWERYCNPAPHENEYFHPLG